MADSLIKIRFEPSGRTVAVLGGTGILEAAAQAGLTIDTPCGGGATCGKCRVRFRSAALAPNESDREHIGQRELDAGWRLACRCHPREAASVEVPESSLFAGGHQILQSTATGGSPELDLTVRKIYVRLVRPSLSDTAPDLERLKREIGDCDVRIGTLRRLHDVLERQDYRGTAVIVEGTLIDFEPGDTRDLCYGAAIDIGTTTLVASLHHLVHGDELAVTAELNPQVRFGDDVLSRIRHGAESSEGLAVLNDAVLGRLKTMVDRLCESADVAAEHVYAVSVAGNTTMQHLAAGIDPKPLGEVPFVPVHSAGLSLDADEFALPLHPAARVHVLPVIGGFIGGDTVAGLIATQLAEQPGRNLLIDIGTNGEIVLACDGRLWATSAAAGPAFEGARISCGMRAADGAIEKVSLFDQELVCHTIGGVAARGICGSGLIDAAAELLRCGVISPQGRLLGSDDVPPETPADIVRRLETDSDGKNQFRLADGDPAGGGRAVVITQRDVRELQLATGAIRAATKTLLKRAGLTAADLDTLLLAGGFGSFIRRSNAQRMGLLPPGIPHDRIRFVGNVSLRGAQWALLSKSVREKAETLARQTELVELSTDPEFQREFAEAMIFPGDEGA